MDQKNLGPKLTFQRADGTRFQIGVDALRIMRQYIQDESDKPEAGGVLLGRHLSTSDDVIVDLVTSPMEGDLQERYRFFRSRRRHQQALDSAWQESGGTCTYLGEWHTHPERTPNPSFTDRIGWQRKLWLDRFTDPIFFVIVGIADICVWEGYRHAWPHSIPRV